MDDLAASALHARYDEVLRFVRRHAPSDVDAEVARTLRKALGGLPAHQREVVVLRLVEGRPFAEIAELVGATEAACKMRYLRGLASIKETFEKEGVEP